MTSLLERLIQTPPRETSGSATSSRYDYQKNWALCRLLELHSTSDDYMLVFEFHEDVIELDSETHPSTVSFYQVKTKGSGHWTLNGLIKADSNGGGSRLSILGLLCKNFGRFPEDTRSLNLVSNAPFKCGLSEASKNSLMQVSICLNELSAEEREKVRSALKAQLGTDEVPDELTFLLVTDLSLEGHDTHAKGKLAEFIEKAFPAVTFRITAVHQALFGEVRRRTNEPSDGLSASEFIARKAIGRTSFANMLRQLGPALNLDQKWIQIETRLNAEKYPYPELSDMADQWKRCEIDRMSSPASASFKKIQKLVQSALAVLGETPTLTEILDKGYDACVTTDATTLDYSRSYVKALLLMEFHAKRDVPTVDSKPSAAPS